jgi:hypothetical protein
MQVVVVAQVVCWRVRVALVVALVVASVRAAAEMVRLTQVAARAVITTKALAQMVALASWLFVTLTHMTQPRRQQARQQSPSLAGSECISGPVQGQ